MTTLGEARKAYTRGRLAGAGPLDLLIMVYEVAVGACRRGDSVRAVQALAMLEGTLDFGPDEAAATGFLRIYRYCAELVRDGQHEEAGRWLSELLEAWAGARAHMPRLKKRLMPPGGAGGRHNGKATSSRWWF
jgi:flagellin-specific chaperone FliS